ncbi:MAG: Ni/Fe hydrogenase subunit alpha [Magnetospirillum sp.]|nr:Ni/Fe hydrogenase subunit alpha [Magnetospirillum sp.]
MTNGGKTRTIRVENLARVEGEGRLRVRIRDGKVQDLRFAIFEPPRFFEAFLRGRDCSEAPDMTSRICGICPVAYIMSATQAMEHILGIQVPRPIRDLRRLMYCGEWIQSHTLHVTMLHAPDFLGLPDAFALARRDRRLVEKALRLKKIGNDLMALVGGRAIHPVNLRLGGFHKVPAKADVRALAGPLSWAMETALDTVRAVARFDFPDLERDYAFMALRHPGEYAIHEGRLVSSDGLDIPVEAFLDHVAEEQVPHSTALSGYRTDGANHHVGPLARYALNHDRLSAAARGAARDAGLGPVCRNPFQSIVVRAVEIVQACEDALALVERYEEPDPPSVAAVPRAGEGHGCTEAPRGILYHRYRIAGDGAILDARIVPPTAQNQRAIERDLRAVIERNLHLADPDLQWRCEQAIRNYDPCISCATHFLTMTVERG